LTRPLITLVVARADNGVIGNEGKLPWHLREDLRHFRAVTIDKPIIMGRKTFESLPRLLERRRHIVLSGNPLWQAAGAECAANPGEALMLVAGAPEVCVIGGAQIYRLFLPYADQVWLTRVHASPAGDTLLEPFDDDIWRVEESTAGNPGEGEPPYEFVRLSRR
jgi:dihydrofolate reductase